jgi:hypothetical protein
METAVEGVEEFISHTKRREKRLLVHYLGIPVYDTVDWLHDAFNICVPCLALPYLC